MPNIKKQPVKDFKKDGITGVLIILIILTFAIIGFLAIFFMDIVIPLYVLFILIVLITQPSTIKGAKRFVRALLGPTYWIYYNKEGNAR